MPQLVLSFLLMAIAFAPTSPIRTVTDGCYQTWQQLIDWSVEVHGRGVDSEALTTLDRINLALEACQSGDGPGLHDGMGVDASMWRPLAEIYFDTADVDRVMCLMLLESGGNPNARNQTSGASGLMQVMPSWAKVHGYEVDDLYDPGVNLWIASQILDQQGWWAWSPYVRGSCR